MSGFIFGGPFEGVLKANPLLLDGLAFVWNGVPLFMPLMLNS